jgi:hypothetical protein
MTRAIRMYAYSLHIYDPKTADMAGIVNIEHSALGGLVTPVICANNKSPEF